MSHRVLEVLAEQERTVAWLARKCGLSVSYVGRMLKGERPLSDEFKTSSAEILGVAVEKLFPTSTEVAS